MPQSRVRAPKARPFPTLPASPAESPIPPRDTRQKRLFGQESPHFWASWDPLGAFSRHFSGILGGFRGIPVRFSGILVRFCGILVAF